MYILFAIIVITFFLMIIENRRECKNYHITEYQVKSVRIKKLRNIVFLTDLHNKVYGNKNDILIKSIRNINPDFVLIGGDMILGIDQEPVRTAYNLVKELSSFSQVYYANGNHEQRMKEYVEKYGDVYEKYKKSLVDLGVIFLENTSIDIDDDIQLSGVEIPAHYYTKFCRDELQMKEINECISLKATEKYGILMAHNPTFVKQYVKWGADLVLSGHYHGGMLRLPFCGGVINPQAKLFPQYTGGHYHVNDTDVIVSKGLGEHTVKIRINNFPEIIVMQLIPE